jgi:hypothetical protein
MTRKTLPKRSLTRKTLPTKVWGRNLPLEKFWRGLASGKYVIRVNQNNSHKKVALPKSKKKMQEVLAKMEEDPEVKAILSSIMSQDAYELRLYPKAKQSSVEAVIKNYRKYFGVMLGKTLVPK